MIVPHYAMSGGTLVALAADEILMDPDAVLGPVDPQLGSLPRGSWPAASILKALEQENPNRDDETLILGDVARKAIAQVRDTVRGTARRARAGDAEAERLAALLSEGAGRTTTRSGWRRRGSSGCPSPTPCPSSSTS